MKRLLPIGLIILIIGAWACTVQAGFSKPAQKRQHLQAAAKYEEKELYLAAIEEYMAAREFTDDDYNIKIKVIDLYEKLGDRTTCIKLCRQVISKTPDRIEAYSRLMRYYKEEENDRKLVPLLDKAKAAFPEEESFQTAYKELEKEYEIMECGYDAIEEFEKGRAVAVRPYTTDEGEGKKESTVINETGFSQLDRYYPQLRLTDDSGKFVVQGDDGEWKIVNIQSYTLANRKEIAFDNMERLSQGYGAAFYDGACHLYNESMGLSKAEWEDIASFHEGYTAAKRGGRWAILQLDGLKETTDYEFDEVKENRYGYAYENQCFAVKKNGAWYFADSKGKQISEGSFDDVKAFESKQPAAAKKGDLWGYVVKSGEWYLEPQYEEAGSYCNGYAPVKKDGLWGYINQYNEMVVEPQFTEAGNVSSSGSAPVKNSSGTWDILRLKVLRYRETES